MDDLNQIPYDYTVEMKNRLEGLDLVERVPEEGLQTEIHNIVWDVVTKTIPKIKKCKKAKWLSEEVLQIGEERRNGRQGRNGKIYLTKYRVLENNKERKESLISEQCN